ncbi:NPC intracellular cholesterol transporter 2 [Odontomachus brunneus]|uniref:NPC intracellular cholesterol transporter 2 n=1 Tax=Odontomachus brunneus TaxID=486640 RepID=UPI0013F1DDAC|nr:NPC intracellular cholesterol transporter 2 [Odontomachus brunneus]
MRVYAFACIIVAFCVAASIQDTPYAPCSDGPLPTSLRVEGCDKSPCSLHKGTDLIAEWDFDAKSDANTLETKVMVKVAGVIMEYPYPQPNACKSLSKGKCPFKKGDQLRYNLKMPISSSYPLVKLNIQFSLFDEKKQVHVCFKLDCKVTN